MYLSHKQSLSGCLKLVLKVKVLHVLASGGPELGTPHPVLLPGPTPPLQSDLPGKWRSSRSWLPAEFLEADDLTFKKRG